MASPAVTRHHPHDYYGGISMDEQKPKRGRGRPPKWTADNPKPKRDEKKPLEVIRKPQRTDLANTQELPEGDNNKYTSFALAIMKLPKIDVRNPEQLRARVVEYFQLCADHDMKPGVAAVGLAIGLDRRRLWEVRSGTRDIGVPAECKVIINEVYDSLEMLWENYMQNGKINPVSGIFLGKNNFGYQDRQEYVVTPNASGLSQADPETIAAKYAELPDDIGGEDS